MDVPFTVADTRYQGPLPVVTRLRNARCCKERRISCMYELLSGI
jgi:hypothetical protein